MSNKPLYACLKCAETEFITSLNSYDRFQAKGDKLYWQATELAGNELELYCRNCSERAPRSFESAVE